MGAVRKEEIRKEVPCWEGWEAIAWGYESGLLWVEVNSGVGGGGHFLSVDRLLGEQPRADSASYRPDQYRFFPRGGMRVSST